MERLPLYCQDQRRGEVTLSLWGPNGARTEIRTSMDDPGDGLYRAFLLGERGELALGVLAPEDGRLTVCRRLYNRDVAALGKLLRGEARRSFRERPAAGPAPGGGEALPPGSPFLPGADTARRGKPVRGICFPGGGTCTLAGGIKFLRAAFLCREIVV